MSNSTGPILMLLATVLSNVGCSRPAVPRPAAPAGAFSEVLDRLQRTAKAGTSDETTVVIGSPAQEPDGRQVVTARRVRPQGTTEYTLHFRQMQDRWVCCGATAAETEATGGKNAHRITGDAIEIDQLVIWLGW